MKSENKNSKPVNESVLKAIDTSCDVDIEFLDRLSEISGQEFELAAEGNDAKNSGTENKWRHIMKNRIYKASAAAILIIAAFIGITMLSGTPAWAMEQTIEALRDIRGIYLAGTACYSGQPQNFEIWARPHSEDPSLSGDFRLHEGEHHVCVAAEDLSLTYVYTQSSQQDVVYITEGLNRSCNPFPSSDLFTQLYEMATNWHEEYRKDEQTGRDCVFVKFQGPALNTARYWLLQCDVETKLPIRLSVWWNEDYSGQPHYDFKEILLNPEMSDEYFQFQVPENTQVVDCRRLYQVSRENPSYGIDIQNLAYGQACRQIAQEYWQAVIDQDTPALYNIRPLMNEGHWQEFLSTHSANPPAKLIDIPSMNHLNDPGTFAEASCIIKMRDGQTAQSVLNIEIIETEMGAIGVVAGTLGPELMIAE